MGFWCRYVLLQLMGSWCTNSSFYEQPCLSLSGCQKKKKSLALVKDFFIYYILSSFFSIYFSTGHDRTVQLRLMEVHKCWICRYAQHSPSGEKPAVKKKRRWWMLGTVVEFYGRWMGACELWELACQSLLWWLVTMKKISSCGEAPNCSDFSHKKSVQVLLRWRVWRWW